MVQINILMAIFLIMFCFSSAFRIYLTRLNISHLRKYGNIVPHAFAGEIEAHTLSQMTSYTIDSSRFGFITGLFGDIVLLIILLSGFLPRLTEMILVHNFHYIISGLIFFAILGIIDFVIDLPFDLYSSFGIEKRYGFSTITWKIWVTDLIKNIIISIVLMGILLSALLALIYYAETSWWLFSWIFFALFQLVILWIYPVLIAPFFNKYEPVKDETLKGKLFSLMERAGLEAKEIFQIDAGIRSKHSNAYFTGLGKTKRIILYDTLLDSHTHDEILSVLAHEIGHWKKKHIIKQLIIIEIISLIFFYCAYRLLDLPIIYQTFGFDQSLSYVGLFILSALLKPILFFCKPFGAVVSRKYEKEADEYANWLVGTTKNLCDALKRLAKDNLANLHPHPFYAWFHYSHPPLTQRISYLQEIDNKSRVEFANKSEIIKEQEA